MLPHKESSPGTWAARGARVDQLAGRIDTVDTATALQLQYVARRSRLRPELTGVVAELAFGRAAA